MDGIRRAEVLISKMRWLVFAVAALLLDHMPPPLPSAALLALCVGYNSAVWYACSTRELFARFGKAASTMAAVLDTLLITAAVAYSTGSTSRFHVLYLFVLVSVSYSSASAKRVVVAILAVLAANAAGCVIGSGSDAVFGPGLSELMLQSGTMAAAGVFALVLAKGRQHDDRNAFHGSRLQALSECSVNLIHARDAHDMARQVLKTVVSETGAAGGEFLLLNRDTGCLESETSICVCKPTDAQSEVIQTACESASRWVCESGRELLTHPGQKTEEADDSLKVSVSIAAAPLAWVSQQSSGEPLGVILIWHLPGSNFTREDLELVQALSALASVGIINLQLYTNLQDTFLRTIQSLATGLEARDHYTRGHSDRVTRVACTVAEAMNVSAQSIDVLKNAALLHDIGKIGVPDAILRKQGKLTAEEWEVMRKHPMTSEDICRPLGLPEEVLFLVLHHHERLDGRGYPSGIPAEGQPLLLRILAIADCFDALRSKRPYREPMTRDELIAEFNRSAGRMFDPTVVETLKSLIESGELEHIYHDMDAEAGLLGRDEYMLKVA